MKNDNFITIDQIMDAADNLQKGEINKMINIIIPDFEVEEIFNKIISDKGKLNPAAALETFLIANILIKEYLMFISTLVEMLIKTWLVKIFSNENNDLNKKIGELDDAFLNEYLNSSRKIYKFQWMTKNKQKITLYDFIKNSTLGAQVKFMSLLKDDYIINLFLSKKQRTKEVANNRLNRNEALACLKTAKEIRNNVNHDSIVLDQNKYVSIFDNNTKFSNIHLALNDGEKIETVFKSIDYLLKSTGYNKVQNRLSRQVERQLSQLNLKWDNPRLDFSFLKLDFIYKK
ncbi:MAG: hypothetical protein GQ557_00920 [Mycoplasmataceae bacterium]|nr:hypothetical protein [Mycoplasmataceae bacterium]